MEHDALLDFVPANIQALSPYQPGKPIEELERELGIRDIVKLASNENPLGPSPRAVEAVRRMLGTTNLYPDGAGYQLRTELALRHGVSPDEIVLGSGSNDLIDVAIRAFCRPGVDETVTVRYAFLMFAIACQTAGVRVVETAVTGDLDVDVDALVAAIGPRTRIVYLPNPNNPTGTVLGKAAFERLLEKIPPGVILLVDEAYQEYAVALRPDYPIAERYRSAARPLIVTARTFSKIHGLAGFRVGYLIADRRVIAYLDRVRLPFNTTSPGQAAALAALGDTEHLERSLQVNAAGIEQLTGGLSALGVRVHPSAGNFLLVDLGRDAMPVYQGLLRRGVIVRPLKPYALGSHLRVSVGLPEENARAIDAFAGVLGG